MSDETNALPVGYVIGGLEIQKYLGGGGFGLTYLAYDPILKKNYAIKEYFPREWARRDGDGAVVPLQKHIDLYNWGLTSFENEASTMANLEHKHIVKAHRYLAENNTGYIVMEFIPGSDLEVLLDGGKVLPTDEVRYLLESILDGLRQVHALQIYHRDIKPGNVLIREANGQPVLIDFGAARQMVQARSKPLTTIVTAHYAPPEQYVGDASRQGPWTDLYAVSALGYVALTGILPPEAPGRYENDDFIPLDQTKYNDPDLCKAINEGLKVSSVERPADIDAWLSISGLRYFTQPTADDGDGSDVVSPPDTKKWTYVNPEHRPSTNSQPKIATELRKNVPNKSSSIGRNNALKYGGMAAVAIVTLIGGTQFLPSQPKPETHFGVSNTNSIRGASTTTNNTSNQPSAPPTSASNTNRSTSSLQSGMKFNDCDQHCPTMVVLPAGSFKMGAHTNSQYALPDEKPQRSINIENSFAMSDTEVTVAQWQACARAGQCQNLQDLKKMSIPFDFSDFGLRMPVRNVNHYQINQYVTWLSSLTGETYRLPSEAEWEYAARGGTQTIFGWGNSPQTKQANCKECEPSKTPSLQPVKSYKANKYGLYDMMGNVWEIVQDCYAPNLRVIATNGAPFISNQCEKRVLKGGSFSNSLQEMRPSRRLGFPLTDSNGTLIDSPQLGFRVVRELT